jgi:hypothetical protein
MPVMFLHGVGGLMLHQEMPKHIIDLGHFVRLGHPVGLGRPVTVMEHKHHVTSSLG